MGALWLTGQNLWPTLSTQWRDSPAKSSKGPCMLFHAFIYRQRPLQRPKKWVNPQMCFMHSDFWRTQAFASYLAPGLVNDQTPITSVRQFYRRKMHWSVCWAVLRLFMRILLRNMLTRIVQLYSDYDSNKFDARRIVATE